LLAAFVRLVETSIFIAVALSDLDVLRVLSGADYLRGFDSGYLWFTSNYIPKALAALGVFASVLPAAGSFALIIVRSLSTILSPGFFIPIFLFELTIGFWLLLKGLRPAVGISPA
jgi:hypothetical protein